VRRPHSEAADHRDRRPRGAEAGEVLVEIKATGICHTDEFTLSGADPEGLFPAILAMKGLASWSMSARASSGLKKGDHGHPALHARCRSCKSCLSRKTNLCTAIRATQGQGLMPDGTSRFSIGGQKVHHYMGCSTFASHTVLPEIALAKIRADAPFEKVCYIGCGVNHRHRCGDQHRQGRARRQCRGVRPRWHRPQRAPGRAQWPGADMIVGVDINPGARGLARKFRHGRIRQSERCEGDRRAHLVELTKGGADYSFECVGNTKLMRQALECCHPRLGVFGDHRRRRRPARRSRTPAVPARHRPGVEGHGVRRRTAAAPMCRGSSTGTWRRRSTSTT